MFPLHLIPCLDLPLSSSHFVLQCKSFTLYFTLYSALPILHSLPCVLNQFVALQSAILQFLEVTVEFLVRCSKPFCSKAGLVTFLRRLQYFARQLQAYIKQLRVALQGKKGVELEETENKIKCLALKTTSNINTLIRVSRENILI